MRRRTRVVVAGGAVAALAAVVAAAVLAFPTGPTARATARPVELPQDFSLIVMNLCIADVPIDFGTTSSKPDSSTDAPSVLYRVGGYGQGLSVGVEWEGDWSVSIDSQGATIQNERPTADAGADAERMSSIASGAIPAIESIYACMKPFRLTANDTPPMSSSHLLQLYRYDNTVLWPCLTSHGVKMGDPPSRDQFVSSFSALTADPFSAMTPTRKMLPRLAAALRDCPLRPAYLG